MSRTMEISEVFRSQKEGEEWLESLPGNSIKDELIERVLNYDFFQRDVEYTFFAEIELLSEEELEARFRSSQ